MAIGFDFAQGYRAKRHADFKNGGGVAFYPHAQYLIITLPHCRVVRLFFRSLLLAFVMASLVWLGSDFRGFISNTYLAISASEYDSLNLDLLPLLFRDLTNEGLLELTDKALFVSNGDEETEIYRSQFLIHNEIDIVSVSDMERKASITNKPFDFAFANGFHSATAEFIDRSLKIGGIVALQLSNDPSIAFQKPSNYKIVYLRRFGSTIMAMKKTSQANPNPNPKPNSVAQRKLCGYAPEAKKAALKNLEDVLLEPPRASSRKSRSYLKRTKYLPDLMGDSLESYSRRIFIDAGLPEKEGGSGTGWFAKHYPTRNMDFEMYKIETIPEESSGKEIAQIGMSDWLRKNVKDEEYVVMKAEAEVVEEMMNSRAIMLVDELFLECKPQGMSMRMKKRSRRAYWECLALYGKLRDEGVAVHQWWG